MAGNDGRWIVYPEAPRRPAPSPPTSSSPARTPSPSTTSSSARCGSARASRTWNSRSTTAGPRTGSTNAEAEVAAANYPLIRQLKIEHAVATAPARRRQDGRVAAGVAEDGRRVHRRRLLLRPRHPPGARRSRGDHPQRVGRHAHRVVDERRGEGSDLGRGHPRRPLEEGGGRMAAGARGPVSRGHGGMAEGRGGRRGRAHQEPAPLAPAAGDGRFARRAREGSSTR